MTPAWWEVILHHAVQTGIECSNRRCLHADWNDCTNRNPSIDSADQNTESTHDTLSFGTDYEITILLTDTTFTTPSELLQVVVVTPTHGTLETPLTVSSYQSIFVASQNENGQVAQEDQIEQNDSSVKLKPKQHLPARTANTAKPESNPASDWSEERSGQGEGSGVQSGADSVGNGDLNSAVWGVAREERASSDWSGWRDADAEGVFGDRVACSTTEL
ncbi:hypothetical protein BLNAU_22449 [Blattamonas nauphoetae]|uniref:Uncharacterized protein n=1 Tax=Blattamonas nauphoetae TaxID=2049346 RepID=A0ABQ9WT19_9EUKA|nr:hypothetical protein BLNAU_22449 [Blattamonas nauphoetae]